MELSPGIVALCITCIVAAVIVLLTADIAIDSEGSVQSMLCVHGEPCPADSMRQPVHAGTRYNGGRQQDVTRKQEKTGM